MLEIFFAIHMVVNWMGINKNSKEKMRGEKGY